MYFNLTEGSKTFTDDEGFEVSDIAEAKRRAVVAARALIAAQVQEGFLDTAARIDIADADGNIRMTVPFAEVFIEKAGRDTVRQLAPT